MGDVALPLINRESVWHCKHDIVRAKAPLASRAGASHAARHCSAGGTDCVFTAELDGKIKIGAENARQVQVLIVLPEPVAHQYQSDACRVRPWEL